MSATVALAELDAETRQRVLAQIGDDAALTVAGKIPATLGDPASLTNDQLADIVIEAVKKIRDRLPYIRTLKERFDSGDRDSSNRLKTPIKRCVTWGEFCDVHLDRSDSAIRKALAVHDGSAHRKPKSERDQPDWTYEIYLDSDAATELYQTMVNLPEWQAHRADGSKASAIYYGLSYISQGSGARNDEIPEIPSFLKTIADEIAAKVGMPVNYIQCHKYGPSDRVSPHPDPKVMIVPMLVLGQERTFRVGGTIVGKDGKPFPPMASQASMKNGTHDPKEEILLRHGSLLTFNGGKTFHSMLPADQDAQFNPNGVEWRISILFRYTTPAMREFGTRGAVEHGSLEQYEAAKREYRARVGWSQSLASAPEPQSPHEPSVWQRIKQKLTPLLSTGADGELALAALLEQAALAPEDHAENEQRADVIYLLRKVAEHFIASADQLESR